MNTLFKKTGQLSGETTGQPTGQFSGQIYDNENHSHLQPKETTYSLL